MKILPEMHPWTKKNRLHFGSHPPLNLNIEFFEGFFNIARWAFFHNLAYISLEKTIMMMCN